MAGTLNPNLLLVIALAPLAGAIIAGLFGRTIGRTGSHVVTIAGVGLSCVLSVWVLIQVIGGAHYNGTVYTWMQVGSLKMDVGFLIDSLSALMMVIVTFVSLMVHVYTIGYMSDDPGYQRFFAYISLFTFSMLMLVMSNNMLQLFFGWEAVGLVSYLLIGFWYTKPSAVFANLKAFVVNRVGDFGFILGIGLALAYTGSLNYSDIFAKAPALAQLHFPGTDWMLITVICISLFIGAMGKSAQFPLHVWLPDSMEGPTPISALIHAATMVTAGIFMVARMSPLFELSNTALSFILVIGGITALFMGFLGVIQNDIKRVIAYSTLSQLGYMTVALGASAYSVAIFHLMTHAFFKACLFLGSGAVIHSMHGALHHVHSHDDAQDMRNMGGLRKHMPLTFLTFLIATLAIAGIPGFSGFFSKDEILWQAFSNPLHGDLNILLWGMGASAALLTAFYMFRLVFMTFFGTCRIKEGAEKHLHESPMVIVMPLIALAILSIAGGYLGLPKLIGDLFGGLPNYIEQYLEPVFANANAYMLAHAHPEQHSHTLEWGMMAGSVVIALIGISIAALLYLVNPELPKKFTTAFPALHRAVYNKWYIDELYDFMIVNPCKALGNFLWKGFDVLVVDGVVNGVAQAVMAVGGVVRYLQSGQIYNYAWTMAFSVVVIVAYYLFK